MNYHFRIHKEKKGYWAECIELSGCRAQGEELNELHEQCQEALNLYLDEPEDSKFILPLPKSSMKLGPKIIAVEVKPEIAFSFLMRRTRLKLGLTQHQMREHLGYQTLYSYQKLETSRFANPTLKSLFNILKKLPQFPLKHLI
jgi:antitoxin HicB